MKGFIYLLTAIAFLIPNFDFADDLAIDLGEGVFDTGSSMKFFAVSLQEDLWYQIKTRYTGGFWLDRALGRKDSGFMAAQIGYEIDNGNVLASVFTGPGLINATDTQLGSVFEFYHSANLGIKDRDNDYLGVFFRHFSDAGLTKINNGRDVIGLEIKVPFGLF